MVNPVESLERLDKAHELNRSPNLEKFSAVLETEQKTKILSSHQKQTMTHFEKDTLLLVLFYQCGPNIMFYLQSNRLSLIHFESSFHMHDAMHFRPYARDWRLKTKRMAFFTLAIRKGIATVNKTFFP